MSSAWLERRAGGRRAPEPLFPEKTPKRRGLGPGPKGEEYEIEVDDIRHPGINWVALHPYGEEEEDEFDEEYNSVPTKQASLDDLELIPTIVLDDGWVPPFELSLKTPIINLIGGGQKEAVAQDYDINLLKSRVASLYTETANAFEIPPRTFSHNTLRSLVYCKAIQLSSRFKLWAEWIKCLKTAIDSVDHITAEFAASCAHQTIYRETLPFLKNTPTLIVGTVIRSIDVINESIRLFYSPENGKPPSATTAAIVGYLAYKPFLDTISASLKMPLIKIRDDMASNNLKSACAEIDKVNVFISQQQLMDSGVLSYANTVVEMVNDIMKTFRKSDIWDSYLIVPKEHMERCDQFVYLFTRIIMRPMAITQKAAIIMEIITEINTMRESHWNTPDHEFNLADDLEFAEEGYDILRKKLSFPP